MTDLNVIYLGQKLSIPARHCQALTIKNQYWDVADDAGSRYRSIYRDYGSFDKFVANGIEDGLSLILSYVDEAVTELIQNGIYDVDQAAMLNRFGHKILRSWAEIDSAITAFIDQVAENIEEAEQLRRLRKASRGRVVGGGFGLKGAVKGIATAGALNAASGLFHSTKNIIGNSMTRAKYQNLKKELYASQDTENQVCSAVSNCVYCIGLCVMEYRGLLQDFAKAEDLEKAKTLRNNLSRIPLNDRSKMAVELLQVSVGDIDTYEILLREYGDEGGILASLAIAVGLNQRFQKMRSTLCEEKVNASIERFRNKLLSQELRILDGAKGVELKDTAIQELMSIAEHLGMEKSAPDVGRMKQRYEYTFIECLQKARAKDRKARTVNNVVYDSVSLARMAEHHRQTAEKQMAELDKQSLSDVTAALNKIKALNDTEPVDSVSDYLAQLQDLHDAVDQEARTFHGTVLKTHDEYRTVLRDYDCLVEQCFEEGTVAVEEEIDLARTLLENGKYHPVACAAFSELIDEKEAARKKHNAAQAARFEQEREIARKTKKVNRWAKISCITIPLVLLAVLFAPFATAGGASKSLIGIVGLCVSLMGQFDGSPWIPCLLIVAFFAVCAFAALGSLKNGVASIHGCILTYLILALAVMAVSATVSALPTIYVLIAIEIFMAVKTH